jgi:hypothetical protein
VWKSEILVGAGSFILMAECKSKKGISKLMRDSSIYKKEKGADRMAQPPLVENALIIF